MIEPRHRIRRRRAVLGGLALGLLLGRPAHGQDTVNVIDPLAPPAVAAWQGAPPPDVVQEAVRRYNDSTVTRVHGPFTVGSGSWIRGDIAVYRGNLRVLGRVTGRVTIVNGSLLLGPSGEVDGEVLVLGGRLQAQPGGRQVGPVRSFPGPAPVVRATNGLLVRQEAPLTLGDLAQARTTFTAGRVATDLVLETERTYTRLEGLPIIAGPTFRFPTPNDGETRIDLRGIIRTEGDPTKQRAALGYRARFEWQRRSGLRYGIGGTLSREVQALVDQPLPKAESGWSAFLLGRDYRDFLEAEGVASYVYAYPLRDLRVEGAISYLRQGSIPASDPVTLFANPDPWRPNPLVDDGHFTTFRATARYDTRNTTRTPTTGWLAEVSVAHAGSGDVAPIALPAEVRAPLPTGRRYAFTTLRFDVRRYARINDYARANLRVVGGGWLAGDPLPVQERVAMGGYDLLPGTRFREQRCAPPSYTDPARTALCDRSLALQVELRMRFGLGLRDLLGAGDLVLLERLIGGDQADVVLFGDMGKAWLSGAGPGRVPTGRIPTLAEWAYDAGVGLDLDGLAAYVATSLRGPFTPRLTLRVQRRF